MIILSHFFTHENQSLQIFVKYDVSTNTVIEIKNIFLISHGKIMPIGNLLMRFFESAVNKLVDETDWREVYRTNREELGDSNVHPVMSEALKPFAQHL